MQVSAGDSGFILDTLLRTTKVLAVIICGGEVTGNNGSCCLFPLTSQKIPDREAFDLGKTHGQWARRFFWC